MYNFVKAIYIQDHEKKKKKNNSTCQRSQVRTILTPREIEFRTRQEIKIYNYHYTIIRILLMDCRCFPDKN